MTGKPTFAVMGCGGVGGYFGARLAKAGFDVKFIARGAHLNAIKASGLRIEGPDEDFTVYAAATDNPADLEPVDFILFAVKLWDTESAAAALTPIMGQHCSVLSLQNGVDSESTLPALLGPGRVLGGVAEISATIAKPGLITRLSPFARVRLGELEQRSSPRSAQLATALSEAGIEVDHSDDIVAAIWNKFMFLVGLSAMTALTQQPIGNLRKDPDTRAMFEQIMREVLALARSKGIGLAQDVIVNRMRLVDELPAEIMASMAHDLQRGHRLELDWLSGAVARMGRELGVPTPANSFVYTALKLIKDGR